MIYLIRHGESIVNIEHRLKCKQLDGDLTSEGRRQARLAGNWLADKQITQILTSPFHRAIQTASIIGELLNIQPSVNPDLSEIDCGELEGHTDSFAWSEWRTAYIRWIERDWNARFPGGESLKEGFDRLTRAIYALDLRENTVLVTHGGITRTVIPNICINAAALQHISDLHNTGMVVLDVDTSGRFVCESWNLIEHLE